MKIVNGWIEGVPTAPSPNHSGTIHPLYIVMHYTATWTGQSAIRTLCNPDAKVSAHFVLDTDGTLTQLVDLRNKAWHAGPSKHQDKTSINNWSIGIEIVNPGYLKKISGNTYEDAYGSKKDMTGKPLVEAKHPRVGPGTYYWPEYTKEQLKTLDELTLFLVKTYPTIKDVVSHEEIDTRGWKTDPGPAFPMARYDEIVVTGRIPDDRAPPPNFPPPPEPIDVEDEPDGIIAWLKKMFDKLFG